MALRCVLSKVPVLGLRSPPMGSLMGPVRALSQAAASRLMSSHGAPVGQTIHSEGSLAEQLESINLRRAVIARMLSEDVAEFGRKWAELSRNWAEHDQRTTAEFAEFEKAMEMHRQQTSSDDAHYNEVVRQNSEDLTNKVHIIGKTCTVLNIASAAAATAVMISANM